MNRLDYQHHPLDPSTLPSQWDVARVGEVALGVQPGFASGKHNKDGAGIPHIRPMNIDRLGRIDLSNLKYVAPETHTSRLGLGDVLFNNTNSSELIGKTAAIMVDEDWGFSNHMTRIRLVPGVEYRFIAHQLHFLWMTGYFLYRCVHHVNQSSLSAKALAETVPIRLAPSAEQRRIVAKIDELFSELDAGVAALERARAGLKRYRAAVLKAAVEGKLTEDWRARHPDTEPASVLLERILTERRRKWEETQLAKFAQSGRKPPKGWREKYREPDGATGTELPSLPPRWTWATVDQLLIEPTCNGLSVKGTNDPPGVPALRLSAMSESGFDYSQRRYLPIDRATAEPLIIREGDFFVSRGNGSLHLVGRGTLAQKPPEAIIFPDTMIRLRTCHFPQIRKLVALLWESRLLRDQIEKKARTTAGIYKISQRDIESFEFPLPSAAEQDEITREVERRLSVVDEIETQVEANLKRAARLRQGILKRAFEGKLVPQDPTDEPAEKLLDRIRRERQASAASKNGKAAGRGRGRSRKAAAMLPLRAGDDDKDEGGPS